MIGIAGWARRHASRSTQQPGQLPIKPQSAPARPLARCRSIGRPMRAPTSPPTTTALPLGCTGQLAFSSSSRSSSACCDEIAPRGTAARAGVINLHKSLGIVVGLLVLARIGWRLGHVSPPWPANTSPRPQRAANVGVELPPGRDSLARGQEARNAGHGYARAADLQSALSKQSLPPARPLRVVKRRWPQVPAMGANDRNAVVRSRSRSSQGVTGDPQETTIWSGDMLWPASTSEST